MLQNDVESYKSKMNSLLNLNISNLRKSNIELSGQKDSKVFGSNKKSIDKSISLNDDAISNYQIEKRDKETKLSDLTDAQNKSSSGRIESIKEEPIRFLLLSFKKAFSYLLINPESNHPNYYNPFHYLPLLFLTSCAQNYNRLDLNESFNSKGFAYIYNEDDFINKR